MIKAHKIRLNPTSEQANSFARAAGAARFPFNWAVAEWMRRDEAGDKPSALAIVIFGMRDRPGGFGQGNFEVEIAWRRGSTEPLAPTLLIAGAYSRPGREMLGRGKPRQIDPNLGQDRGCGRLLDADDALDELHGFFKRAQMLLNLLLNPFDRGFEESDMSQDLVQQEAMMGLDSSLQGQAQIRQFRPQPPPCQLR